MPISGLSDKDGNKKITTTTGGSKEMLDVISYNASGNPINGGLVTEAYDAIYVTYPIEATEVYTYKLLGSTVATVTVTYTSSTKTALLSVIKS